MASQVEGAMQSASPFGHSTLLWFISSWLAGSHTKTTGKSGGSVIFKTNLIPVERLKHASVPLAAKCRFRCWARKEVGTVP